MRASGLNPPRRVKKTGLTFVSRTAEQPGQTLNVDLCFVPADHPAVLKLTAVSGSSGRLVISPTPSETPTPSAPGLIFADANLAYSDAMQQFVAASPDAQGHAPAREQSAAVSERAQRKADRKAWLRAADTLRLTRHQQRAQRKVEDQAWQTLREQLRTASTKRKRLLRLPRRAQQRQRAIEDEQWRAQRRELRAKLSPFALVSGLAMPGLSPNEYASRYWVY